MTTVPQGARALQIVLTTTATSAARRPHFIERQRQLIGASFMQGLGFGQGGLDDGRETSMNTSG